MLVYIKDHKNGIFVLYVGETSNKVNMHSGERYLWEAFARINGSWFPQIRIDRDSHRLGKLKNNNCRKILISETMEKSSEFKVLHYQ